MRNSETGRAKRRKSIPCVLILTGTAGEHYVAYKLSCLGYVAALPRGGSVGVDILVGNREGTRTVAIQVKTTDWAVREKGRGDARSPHELQFPLGFKAARIDNPNLLFAFVDLRGITSDEPPDVYLVPSTFVCDHCREWIDDAAMARFHIEIAKLEPFKNNWSLIDEALT